MLISRLILVLCFGFLFWSAEIGVHLLHVCVLYAVKYGNLQVKIALYDKK